MIKLVSGDDAVIYTQLKKDGAPFSIDAGATITAMLVSLDRDTTHTGAITQSNGSAGADWTTSKVTVVFSSSDTSPVPPGRCWLELQVDDGIKLTWFLDVLMIKGNIP